MYWLLGLLLLTSCQNKKTQLNEKPELEAISTINWNNEIIYHVMQRSFYDGNGDLHGDLNGFVEKLEYLKELGVTTILFTPLYESDFYHNYFPINYKNIDPEYGTMEDYIRFVKAVHSNGMKFLMDMETQYAQSGNIWFDDSYQNPDSQYSDFIYYSDTLNRFPEQIFMKPNSPLKDFNLWPGKTRNIVLLDLNHSKVKDYMKDFYTFWVDPNGDGKFDDGVDGFRIDHIMDDLDYKGLFTNMYQDFWKPIFNTCKDINPKLFVLGEQSNWNEYGEQMVAQSGADAAFSFPLRFAIAGEEGTHDMYIDPAANGVVMEPERIHLVVEESLTKFSDSTFTVNFLENHDTARWASVVNENEHQLRHAAILNLLLPGVPSIYYGQELGLTGQTHEWGSDANHIPVREGFPWTNDYNDPGNAVWYKDTGEWWDNSIWKSKAINELNLEVQRKNQASLWHHYKELISIRKEYEVFRLGGYEPVKMKDPELMAFKRSIQGDTALVLINLGGNDSIIDMSTIGKVTMELMNYHSVLSENSINLGAHGFIIVQLTNP